MNLIARPHSSARRYGIRLAVALLAAGGLTACGNGIERADRGSEVVLTDEEGATLEPASSEQVAFVRDSATAYETAAGIEMDMTISLGGTEFMEMSSRTNNVVDPTDAVGEMTMSMPMTGAGSIEAVFTDGTMYMQMGGQALGPDGETWMSMSMEDAIASGTTVDPNQSAGALQTLEEAGDVKFVGNDEIDGEPVEVYEFSASGESWADLSNTSVGADASAALEETDVTGTVSITEAGEARAMTVNLDMAAMLAEVPESEIEALGGTAMTVDMTMRPIDETITVSAPPADQVVDAEEMGFDPSTIGG